MSPSLRAAGVAGVLAGIGLTLEFALFMASGWTPAIFSQPATAIPFLQTSGALLRAAAFVGFFNLALAVVWIAGLAGRVARAAPTGASATLYLGLVGMTAHALVPLGLWLAVPAFLDLTTQDPSAASGGWSGFAALLSSAGGVGYLFDGFAMIAAGGALIATRTGGALLGWLGLVAGGCSALTVLADETTLDALAGTAHPAALLLTIAFRIWSGYVLWCDGSHAMSYHAEASVRSA